MPNSVIIVGGFIEIIELCEENSLPISGIIDNTKESSMYSYKVFGNDHDASGFPESIKNIPLIITPDRPSVRKRLSLYYSALGYSFFNLTSKKANLAKSARIGRGTILQSGVNISSEVVIGDFVKVNSCANIMHNSEVGHYTTIAPNAVVLGYVSIGEGCYIGANATILPHVQIADNVTIGAGTVVTKNISEVGAVFVGVPARRMR